MAEVTPEQLRTAARNALAAGDEAAARRLLAAAEGVEKREVSAPGAFGRGALQGLSFGFADEIAGGLHALGKGTYREGVDESRRRYAMARGARPGAFLTGELLGGGASAIGTGGVGLAARGAAVAGRLGARAATVGGALGNVPRGARIAALGTGEGAVAGAGYTEGDVGERAGGAVLGAGIGLGMTGLGMGASQVVQRARRRANPEFKVGNFLRKHVTDDTADEILGRLKKGEVIADLDPDYRKLLSDVADEGTRRSVREMLERRAKGEPGRITATREDLGLPGMQELEEALVEQGKKNTRKYREAEIAHNPDVNIRRIRGEFKGRGTRGKPSLFDAAYKSALGHILSKTKIRLTSVDRQRMGTRYVLNQFQNLDGTYSRDFTTSEGRADLASRVQDVLDGDDALSDTMLWLQEHPMEVLTEAVKQLNKAARDAKGDSGLVNAANAVKDELEGYLDKMIEQGPGNMKRGLSEVVRQVQQELPDADLPDPLLYPQEYLTAARRALHDLSAAEDAARRTPDVEGTPSPAAADEGVQPPAAVDEGVQPPAAGPTNALVAMLNANTRIKKDAFFWQALADAGVEDIPQATPAALRKVRNKAVKARYKAKRMRPLAPAEEVPTTSVPAAAAEAAPVAPAAGIPAAAAVRSVPAETLPEGVEDTLRVAVSADTAKEYIWTAKRLYGWLNAADGTLDDAHVARYLSQLYDEGKASKSLETVVKVANKLGFKKGTATRAVLKAASRLGGTRNRGHAPPITEDRLNRMVAPAIAKATPRGLMEAAALRVGVMTGSRPSDVTRIRAQDIRFLDDGLAQVRIWRTKTIGPGAKGGWKTVGPETAGLLRQWREVSGITEGPLFRKFVEGSEEEITRKALEPRTVNTMWQDMARAGGVKARITGNSTRTGLYAIGIARGLTLEQLMQQADHLSHRVAMGYAEDAPIASGPIADMMRAIEGGEGPPVRMTSPVREAAPPAPPAPSAPTAPVQSAEPPFNARQALERRIGLLEQQIPEGGIPTGKRNLRKVAVDAAKRLKVTREALVKGENMLTAKDPAKVYREMFRQGVQDVPDAREAFTRGLFEAVANKASAGTLRPGDVRKLWDTPSKQQALNRLMGEEGFKAFEEMIESQIRMAQTLKQMTGRAPAHPFRPYRNPPFGGRWYVAGTTGTRLMNVLTGGRRGRQQDAVADFLTSGQDDWQRVHRLLKRPDPIQSSLGAVAPATAAHPLLQERNR